MKHSVLRWTMRVRALTLAALLAFALGACGGEIVTFEASPAGLRAASPLSAKNASVTLAAELTKPEGDGPFAAVVMLHGCSGLWKPWGDVWARRLVRWGYLAFRVDSFGPRGYPEGVCGRAGAVGEQAEDAHAAKAYLQGLPFVDPSQIGVMGMSHGGAATLRAVQNTHPPRSDPFEAAIALYPSCGGTLLYRLDAPLLILTGELDDWTPSGLCERMLVEEPTDHTITLHVYPNAAHAFDVDLPERQYLGHTMKFHPEAARDAEARVRDFLAEHLRRRDGLSPTQE